jgi:hypothetical protein
MSTEAQRQSFPLIPAVTDQSGRYMHTTESGGDWEYAYDIHAAGTKSERRIGHLRAEGLQRVIAAARPGDTVQTPWGLMARMPDSLHERGFLLEHALGRPIDPSQGSLLEVPDGMLARGGRWRTQVGPWRYAVIGMAMGTRSERRIGRLHFGQTELRGKQQGDHADAPWGRLRWMGPINLEATTDHEQGFLLRGTRDRSLDDLEGDAVFPDDAGVVVQLQSLYLESGFRLSEDGLQGHTISLLLSGHLDHDAEMAGTLVLDPNRCSLNEFGDPQVCTKIAIRAIPVKIVLQRHLGDPRHLRRRLFEVTGPDLSRPLALIVQGGLERCYLKLEQQLAPLYLEHDA